MYRANAFINLGACGLFRSRKDEQDDAVRLLDAEIAADSRPGPNGPVSCSVMLHRAHVAAAVGGSSCHGIYPLVCTTRCIPRKNLRSANVGNFNHGPTERCAAIHVANHIVKSSSPRDEVGGTL